jgi:hypothetical protein
VSGYIIFEGPSLVDGAPVAVIVTENTRNAKTGNMLQTWIIRTDVPPHHAAADGRDESICGDCALRKDPETGKRRCYVKVYQAPLAVYKAYHRGRYTRADARTVGKGRLVRIGSYGDPATVPAGIWHALASKAIGRTGYTHQHSHAREPVRENAEALRGLVMASVETPEQAETVAERGWRTFRVRLPSEPLLSRERTCPASYEAGARVQCATCRACDGATRGNRIAIMDHGPTA